MLYVITKDVIKKGKIMLAAGDIFTYTQLRALEKRYGDAGVFCCEDMSSALIYSNQVIKGEYNGQSR